MQVGVEKRADIARGGVGVAIAALCAALAADTGTAAAAAPVTVQVLPQAIATNGAPLKLGFQAGLLGGAGSPLRAECFTVEAVEAAMRASAAGAAATNSGAVVRAAMDPDTDQPLYVVENREKSAGGMAIVTTPLRKGVSYTVRVTCRRLRGGDALQFGFAPIGSDAGEEAGKSVAVKEDGNVQKMFSVTPLRDGAYQCAFRVGPESAMVLGAFSMVPDDAEAGWNREALEALRTIGPSVLRWPAAESPDFYNWYDGVGPRELRGAADDGAQGPPDSAFGTLEFVLFCRRIGAEPLLRVTMALPGCADARVPDVAAGAQLAADWVAYCNATNDHPLAALRRRHGAEAAPQVKRWELVAPRGAAATVGAWSDACQAYVAKMKAEDPAIAVGVTASSLEQVDAVLRRCGDGLDFVSCGAPGAEAAIRKYNRERGVRVAWADTRLAPLYDRYIAQVVRRLEAGDASDRVYYGGWYRALGVASAALARLRCGADGVTCAPFYPEQVLHRVSYARNMPTEEGLVMALINRFPALTPLATEGAPTEAEAPFRVVAAWTEDPKTLVIFLYNSGVEPQTVRLDLTALKRQFAFCLSDQLMGDLAKPRAVPTLPVSHRQKAGSAITQVVLCECLPASFTRLVVKE